MTPTEEREIRDSMRRGISGEYRPAENFTITRTVPDPEPVVIHDPMEIWQLICDEI
jgi:hypothetical protein